ncbi:TraR/DksA C4-type zinc finger protein [Streptomyces sp. NPDC006655]|uniref:TraR/DksA family transcriptional regulator n=1 Tax=Streptomyces sp. NPDC006655 TaxID=3156898 RepID=UPI003452C0DE
MTPDTPRTGTRRARLRPDDALERLAHERASRLTQLQALHEAGPGAAEPATSTQKDTLQRVLTEVEAACARVRDGTYGVCLKCSRSIPVERLEILPHTPFCVPCRRGSA